MTNHWLSLAKLCRVNNQLLYAHKSIVQAQQTYKLQHKCQPKCELLCAVTVEYARIVHRHGQGAQAIRAIQHLLHNQQQSPIQPRVWYTHMHTHTHIVHTHCAHTHY